MAITSRGESRPASVPWSVPWPDDNGENANNCSQNVSHGLHPATDAEILAAVAKSKDLELITGDELLEAIDATRVAGMVSEHELDLVRFRVSEGRAS